MKWKLFGIIPVLFCVLFFSQSMCSVNEDSICAICQERLVADQEHGDLVCLDCDHEHPERSCIHSFHERCLDPLRDATNSQQCSRCPICRAANVAIVSLPPQPVNCVTRFVQKVNNKATSCVTMVRQWVANKRQNIQQRLLTAIPSIYGLWQARNAAFAGATSALVGVPYVQGAAASGVGGLLRPHATLETAWYYPGAFSVGYVGALMYIAMVKYCVCCLTEAPAEHPLIASVPFLPVLCAAAFNLWRNS